MKAVKYILLWSVFLLALLAACKDSGKKETMAVADLEEQAEIRPYTIDRGTVMVNNLELFTQDSDYRGQSSEFADAFYIIQHPKGALMWDAALAESLAMEAFEAFAEEKGATVYLQHQKEDFEKMPKAPNYLN